MPNILRYFAVGLIIVISHIPAFTQSITLRLVVAPRVPGKLAHWDAQHESVKALVTNSGDPVDARFESELYRNGVLVAETRYTDMPTIKIPKGQSMFNADQIIPVTAITFRDDLAGTGGWLLAGTYDMSVRLCSGGLDMGLCMFTKQRLTVAPPAPPAVLLTPPDRGEIEADKPTVFTWKSGVTKNPLPVRSPVHYIVQIYQLEPDMTPRQALVDNFLVVSHEDTVTQFVLTPDKGITKKLPTRYVWMVTSVSEQDEALSKSEAFVFHIRD